MRWIERQTNQSNPIHINAGSKERAAAFGLARGRVSQSRSIQQQEEGGLHLASSLDTHAQMTPPQHQQRTRRQPASLVPLLLLASLLGTSRITTTQAFSRFSSSPPAAASSAARRWGGVGPTAAITSTSTTLRQRTGRSGRRGAMEMRQKFNPREDYYARLEIDRTASLNDVKRAYRCVGWGTAWLGYIWVVTTHQQAQSISP
jgi:hypothetical protein